MSDIAELDSYLKRRRKQKAAKVSIPETHIQTVVPYIKTTLYKVKTKVPKGEM